MRYMLDEIQACLAAGLLLPAITCALLIPDACGAIDYPKEGNSTRYAKWYSTWVLDGMGQPQPMQTGRLIYKLRCNLAHEVKLSAPQNGVDHIVITVPLSGQLQVHHGTCENAGKVGYILDAESFCEEIADAARRWFDHIAADSKKMAAVDGLLQYRPEGFWPFVTGTPVVA